MSFADHMSVLDPKFEPHLLHLWVFIRPIYKVYFSPNFKCFIARMRTFSHFIYREMTDTESSPIYELLLVS